jgi:hypothetical protein
MTQMQNIGYTKFEKKSDKWKSHKLFNFKGMAKRFFKNKLKKVVTVEKYLRHNARKTLKTILKLKLWKRL